MKSCHSFNYFSWAGQWEYFRLARFGNGVNSYDEFKWYMRISVSYIYWIRIVAAWEKVEKIRKNVAKQFLMLTSCSSLPGFLGQDHALKLKPSFIFFFLLFFAWGSPFPSILFRSSSRTIRECSHWLTWTEFPWGGCLPWCGQCMMRMWSCISGRN